VVGSSSVVGGWWHVPWLVACSVAGGMFGGGGLVSSGGMVSSGSVDGGSIEVGNGVGGCDAKFKPVTEALQLPSTAGWRYLVDHHVAGTVACTWRAGRAWMGS
jgi:hypothetical protein